MVYKFSTENPGIIRYLLLSKNSDGVARNALIEAYFTKNKFTVDISKRLSDLFNISDPLVLYAKYLLLFSSLCIPLFINTQNKNDDQVISRINDERFEEIYRDEILRIIK